MSGRPVAEVLQDMAQLPFTDLEAIAPGNSLILAPHPDDESLGCGGLIALSSDKGRPPLIVCVTDGAGSHPGSRAFPPARLTALRQQELRTAVQHLGVAPDRVQFLDLPDTQAPLEGADFDAAVDDVVSLVRDHSVTTVFASWSFDPHCDHEATARLGEEIARRTGVQLMFYPVWGWLLPPDQRLPLGQIAGVRLDISPALARKRAAIAAHATQYSDLITDDTGGFRLPPSLLAVFERPFEVFLHP